MDEMRMCLMTGMIGVDIITVGMMKQQYWKQHTGPQQRETKKHWNEMKVETACGGGVSVVTVTLFVCQKMLRACVCEA